MKRSITLLAAAIFGVTLAFVNIGSGFAQTKDTDEKVYRDDDLSKSKMDQDQSTLNKMESEKGKQSSEGTSAGGIRKDEQGKTKSKSTDDMGTEETYPPLPY